MSSLAATQADGYYVSSEYYDSGAYKKLTKNQWQAKQNSNQQKSRNSEPGAGSTGKNASDVLPPVVRFELPSSAICQCCKSYISKGTRFNAQKRKSGDFYLSTPILEFEMTSRCCAKTQFIIRTNPQQRSFDYVSGLQKLHETKAPLKGEVRKESRREIDDEEDEADVLSKLETAARGQRKTMSDIEQLQQIQKFKEKIFLQDADANASIRNTYRQERNRSKKRRREAEALGYREGIVLADPAPVDSQSARQITFGSSRGSQKKRFHQARSSSIFLKSSVSKGNRKARTHNARSAASTLTKPDRVTSSPPSVSPIVKEDVSESDNSLRGGKKRLIIGQVTGNQRVNVKVSSLENTTTKNQTWSAVDALAEYGSDTGSD